MTARKSGPRGIRQVAPLLGVALVACTGTIGLEGVDRGQGGAPSAGQTPAQGGGSPGSGTPAERGPRDRLVPGGAVRRLSARELDATLDAWFPELRATRTRLPPDAFGLFDTAQEDLDSGLAFLEASALVAQDLTARARADVAVWRRIRACGAADPAAECVGRFYDDWAPRLLRRAGTAEERARFVALADRDLGGVDDALAVALEGLLRHPEFLHMVALGTGTGRVRELSADEILARLSFFLWGQSPGDALRAQAARVALLAPAGRVALAREMLADGRARAQVAELHAQWLGYAGLSREGALAQAMWRESAALIDRVVFEQDARYERLWLSEQTFADPVLAAHYRLPVPAAAGWVDLAGTRRRGILGHGTFLSAFANVADTSPVKRGKGVQNRLLCRRIELPTDADVDVDVHPGEDECRVQFLRERHAVGGCAGCHRALDGVGFGLERFDRSGAPREHEDGKPACLLDGRGELDGQAFEGPAGLAGLLTEHEEFEPCVTAQVLRFHLGRDPALTQQGQAWTEALVDQARAGSGGRLRFRELLLAIVAAPEFAQVAIESDQAGPGTAQPTTTNGSNNP